MKATLEITDITEWWDITHSTDFDPSKEVEIEPESVLAAVIVTSDEECWEIALSLQSRHQNDLSSYLTHANPSEGSWIYEGRTVYGYPASRRVYESNCVLTENDGTVIR